MFLVFLRRFKLINPALRKSNHDCGIDQSHQDIFLVLCRSCRFIPASNEGRVVCYLFPLLLAYVSDNFCFTATCLLTLLSMTSELLKDETSEVDLIGPTLPVLKELCDRGLSPKNGPLAVLPLVMNGMLSACLQNVEDMRRVFPQSASNFDPQLTFVYSLGVELDYLLPSKQETTFLRAFSSSLRCP